MKPPRLILLAFSALALGVIAASAHSTLIQLFSDLDRHVDAASLVVARCVSVADQRSRLDGIRLGEFEAVRAIKGDLAPGKRFFVALVCEPAEGVEPDRSYLLRSGEGGKFSGTLGGRAVETSFITNAQLAVVRVRLDPKTLDGKTPKEQVAAIFAAQRDHLARTIDALATEKALLDKAVGK